MWTSKTVPDNFYLLWPNIYKDNRHTGPALIVICTYNPHRFVWRGVHSLTEGTNTAMEPTQLEVLRATTSSGLPMSQNKWCMWEPQPSLRSGLGILSAGSCGNRRFPQGDRLLPNENRMHWARGGRRLIESSLGEYAFHGEGKLTFKP